MRTVGWVLALALGAVSVWAQEPPRKRVAVFDFDNAAVQGSARPSPFADNSAPNIGKVAADLLITKLVQEGKVSVIERNAIDKLLAEQNFTNTDRTDPLTAAKLGRILGVDAIILGTITHYDYFDKTTGGGTGGRFVGFGGNVMKTKHDITAKVQISTRLVSPDTAEVLAVSQGTGELVRKGVKIDVRDMSQIAIMTGATANNPLIHDCMDSAIAQLSSQLKEAFPKLPLHAPVIDGLVADASGTGQLILNVGAHDGLRLGDHLQVWRAGREIRDPANNKILMRDDTLLGEAVVTTVNDISSVAQYKGSEPVKVSDLVKSFPKLR
ncbi:MAG TPA: CsgG/HfaB family protein [Terriglobales bacterium]|jgi:curli biogenesis system outer membrane secretion channel CsgG|nr:CsgG/HfaB family protein [Terriglobales bacterium]